MREIKFRGKSSEGQWVYGYPIIVSYKAWIKDINDKTTNPRRLIQDFADFRCVEVEKETVGQYTGLKDKNGKEIYEGDICSHKYRIENYYYVVEWVFAGFQLVMYKKANADCRGISDGINQGYLEDSDGLEVVGNIYENLELLEEEGNE